MSRLNKTWTADEIDYLISAWGNVNMATITKHLDRSECAIRLKAGKLNLGPFLANGYRYITISNLYKLIRPNTSATYLKTSWVKNRNLPTHNISRSSKTNFIVVYIDEFWMWAEKNQYFLDFSKLGRYQLGPEPDWVNPKREADILRNSFIKATPWTSREDNLLKELLVKQKYGYKELSQILCRSEGAISKAVLHAKKIATVAHHLKEYPYNIVSVVEKIFLNEKVLIFVAIAGQLAYIKREKNMQYCNKSKTESKEGVSMDDKTEFVRMATTQCLKYMSVNEANKVEQILSVLLTKYSLKKETYALSTETVTPNQKLVNTFLAIKKISGLTDKSLKAYNNEIQMMLKAINKPIADIKVNDIRAYLAFEQLNKNVSNSYLDTKLRYLKSFFKTLRIEGYIPNDPAEKITKIKAEKVIRKPFTPIETEKIRDAAGKDLRLKAIIEFLLSTGCRVTEVENANRSDIKDDKLIITGKGNKQRYVYLNAQAKLALEKYENTRSDTNNALFVSKVKIKGEYKRLEKGQIENIIRELGKDIGIENCHPHRFRRTMATDALRAGMPIEQVSLMLGHEELTTTQIYARSDESDVYQAHQKYVR